MSTPTRRVDDLGADQGPIDCPKCGKPMRPATLGAITIDRCTGCSGLWLDALEKDRLIESHLAAQADVPPRDPARAAAAAAKTRILCPRDRSTMIHMVDARQPHVGFESCTVCGGIFLDAGELTDLSELTLRERLRSILG